MKQVKNVMNRDQRELRLLNTLFTDGTSEISAIAWGSEIDKFNRKLEVTQSKNLSKNRTFLDYFRIIFNKCGKVYDIRNAHITKRTTYRDKYSWTEGLPKPQLLQILLNSSTLVWIMFINPTRKILKSENRILTGNSIRCSAATELPKT